MIALVLASSTSALGCEPRIAVELIDVVGVEPECVDAGHRLAVTGHRFLLGHPCTIVLRGTWHRPGLAPERREHAIEGVATSSELVEATITGDVVRQLGGRATFIGDLEVRFDAASIPGGVVHGTLTAVTLDIVPAARASTRGDLVEIERVLGAHFAEASEESGAEIAHVDSDGLAMSLGLLPGDRIVARGNLHVLAAADLALDEVPPAERALRVVRGGGEPFEVRTTAPLPPAGLDRARAHQLAALLALLGVALGLGARAPRLDGRAARLAGPAHVVASIALAVLMHRAIVRGLVSDVSTLVGIGVLVIGLSGAADPTRDRWSAFVTSARMLAFATVALAAAALAGTTDVIVLSAHAAGSPIEWPGLGTALGPAAALSLVVVCARPVTAREPGQSEPRARSVFAEGALDALVLGLTAALATAVLFGGTGGAEPAATLAFVVRAVVVAVGIAVARPTLCVLPRPALATLGVASAGLSALGAYFAVAEPLDPSQRTALAETIGIALVLALGMSVVPRHRAPLPLEQELEL